MSVPTTGHYDRYPPSKYLNPGVKQGESALGTEGQLLKRYAYQQEIVAALGQKALMDMEPQALIEEALTLVSDGLNIPYSDVWEYVPEHNKLLLKAVQGFKSALQLNNCLMMPVKENLQANLALASHAPVAIDDLSSKPELKVSPLLNNYPVASGVVAVIEGGDKPFGVIGAYSPFKRHYSKDEINFLQSVANVLALAIGRKQVENQVRSNEKRLQRAQAAAKIGTFEWNILTNEVVMTPEFEALYGFSLGSKSKRNWMRIIHPEDRQRLQNEVDKTIKDKRDLDIEYRVIWPDNSVHWLMVKGHLLLNEQQKPYQMLGVAMDICDRKQTEEGLTFLSEATRVLASSLDYQTTLSRVAKLAVPRISDWCAIDLLSESGRTRCVELTALAHVDPKKVKWAQEYRKLNPVDLSQDTGIAQVLKTGKALFYPLLSETQLREAARSDKEWRTVQKIGLSAIITVPLIVNRRVIGAITLVSSTPHRPFGVQDLHIAEQLADRAAVAIENARLYQSAQREISVRREIEDALLKSRTQMEIIFQNVADAIIVQDNQGKLLYANSKGLEIMGYALTENLGNKLWNSILENYEIYDEHKRPLSKSGLRGFRIVEGELIDHMILFLQHKKTKNEFWVLVKSRPVYDAQGQVMMVVNIISDITEQKRSQQEQLKLASIVESSDDAIFSKDLEGNILSWNPGAEKMYGYIAKEMVGQPVTKIMSDDQLEEFAEIMEIIKLGESIDHLETMRLRKDGKPVDVSISVSPLKDQNGQVIGASCIARDISISKELERRKDAFIGMASHELKTPLTSMKAFAQVIERRLGMGGDAQLRSFLTKLDNQIDRLADLVNDLLDLSKIEAGKLELKKAQFNIGQLIRETVEDIQSVTPTHVISLEGIVDQTIMGDKDRINQILVNLLTNAVKYSPGKDRVVVKTAVAKNKITIIVQDFGIGIDEEHQERIFDRFFREQGVSEKTFPGLGIGLYISAELVRRHGGRIWVESRKGKGSIFFVSFPLE